MDKAIVSRSLDFPSSHPVELMASALVKVTDAIAKLEASCGLKCVFTYVEEVEYGSTVSVLNYFNWGGAPVSRAWRLEGAVSGVEGEIAADFFPLCEGELGDAISFLQVAMASYPKQYQVPCHAVAILRVSSQDNTPRCCRRFVDGRSVHEYQRNLSDLAIYQQEITAIFDPSY